LGWATGHAVVAADLEGQRRPVRIADIDGLTVLDVDHRHPPAVDESAVQRTVVDRQPPALVEAQQQMGARDQGMGNAHVGPEVTADHYVMACRECPLRPVVPDG
jgi:hypothetical protein